MTFAMFSELAETSKEVKAISFIAEICQEIWSHSFCFPSVDNSAKNLKSTLPQSLKIGMFLTVTNVF